ncbi:MAG: TlpA family protein disulfide reductase [Acidobacteria bacterium]|nr:TlpA family protein disulfide reductase [Acidobacteriota bacterium]
MGKHRGQMLQPGDEAPDLRLEKLGGGEESLREAGGVLLVFFKISCPVCQFTLPYLDRLHPGVRVWAISQNDAGDTRDFARHFRLTLPILLDPEDRFPASNAFGITSVPTLFQLGGGRVEKVIEGWDRKEMAALGAVRDGDNVPAFKAG